MERVYLDNAATSFPKAPGVVEAVARYMERVGASPGRGAYRESREGAAVLRGCRDAIAALIGAEGEERIVFTLNCSDALHLAIKGVVLGRVARGLGTHIVCTQMDHNSVLRPLRALEQIGALRVSFSCVEADGDSGLVDPGVIERAIGAETALVCVAHGSNVTGTLQDLGAIARVCRSRGVALLVDAAQSLGHVPVDVRALGVDLLAFPGHKGLLGPLGTGGLYVRAGMEDLVATVREGGTGSRSEEDVHPDEMPDRYEAGSHNTPGLAGLERGVRYLLERGIESVRAHEEGLMERFLSRVGDLEDAGFRLLGTRRMEERVGVFSLVHGALDSGEVARRLEEEFGVLVRSGIHCAPRAHRAMGSLADGGAVRLSVSCFTTDAQMERALEGLVRIGVSARVPG